MRRTPPARSVVRLAAAPLASAGALAAGSASAGPVDVRPVAIDTSGANGEPTLQDVLDGIVAS